MDANTEYAIYVASLSDYNNGLLHGAWIDLDNTDEDEVMAAISDILRTSKYPNVTVECPECAGEGELCLTCDGSGEVPSAEEWAVHDYNGIPTDFGECPDLSAVLEYVNNAQEHGEAYIAYVECRGVDCADADSFQDAYAGEASTEMDWLYEFIDSTGMLDEMPDRLRNYFDYDAYLRDIEMSGDIHFWPMGGTCYAFWNH